MAVGAAVGAAGLVGAGVGVAAGAVTVATITGTGGQAYGLFLLCMAGIATVAEK